MTIKAVFCDLDGSLMNPSAGLYVKKEIEEKLIQLQEKGVLVILNSARTFQGVYPLSKQIHMEQYGGYCISCNGSHVYDVLKKKTVFEYSIEKEMALDMWNICKDRNLVPGFTQPDYCVALNMSRGYDLDHDNCMVDYYITYTPEKYMDGSIWKCCVSASKEMLDEHFENVKQLVESKYPVLAIRSTPDMADIVNNESDKLVAATRLLNELNISWDEVSVIGDGTSDVGCIKAAHLGVTLENGNKACKENADMIVPSCYEDGCIQWLDYLLEEK